MTAPIIHHPAFKASLAPQPQPRTPQPTGILSQFAGWFYKWTLAFEHGQACRRTARIVRSLPNSVQKDIGWRSHCYTSPNAQSGPAYVATLAPRIFFNQS
ncbi:MAG: hypothetical protein AAFY73_08680 [Pseudomonadota bacterium]